MHVYTCTYTLYIIYVQVQHNVAKLPTQLSATENIQFFIAISNEILYTF